MVGLMVTCLLVLQLTQLTVSYHHCTSITRGALLTEGTLHQVKIPTQTELITKFFDKWKDILKIQYNHKTLVINKTTIVIPTTTKRLSSARAYCLSMNSVACPVSITKDIITQENQKYFTGAKVIFNKDDLFCQFRRLKITDNDNCLYQLRNLKDTYNLKGLQVDKEHLKQILRDHYEGVLTITKIRGEFYLGLDVHRTNITLPCCSKSQSRDKAEVTLQNHFTDKIQQSETKMKAIANYFVKQRVKRSIWSFFGVATEDEIQVINTNLQSSYENIKSQKLAIEEVSESQMDITRKLNEEASILNVITENENRLETNMFNLTSTLNSAILNTSYQLQQVTKHTNFILFMLDLSDKLKQIDQHLDNILDYLDCDTHCPERLLGFDKSKYVGKPSNIDITSSNDTVILTYTLYKRWISVFHVKCIPYQYTNKFMKIEVPNIIALDYRRKAYLDISKESSCYYKNNIITCSDLFHRKWSKQNFDCIKAITEGNFSLVCKELVKTYDQPDQDILPVDKNVSEIFSSQQDTVTLTCANYTHRFSIRPGTNLVKHADCLMETSKIIFEIEKSELISHGLKTYLNFSWFDNTLHFEPENDFNNDQLDLLLSNEQMMQNQTNKMNQTEFHKISLMTPFKPLFMDPKTNWHYWLLIVILIVGFGITLTLGCYYNWCCMITKCFSRHHRSYRAYEPTPTFHCSSEKLELVDQNSAPDIGYTLELEQHPGYKVLLLKQGDQRLAKYDKKWKGFSSELDLSKVPKIPKTMLAELTPNLDSPITLNTVNHKIEISEFGYFYGEVSGPGWYKTMDLKLPSYAFPIPNYKIRAKQMALARKGVSHPP